VARVMRKWDNFVRMLITGEVARRCFSGCGSRWRGFGNFGKVGAIIAAQTAVETIRLAPPRSPDDEEKVATALK